METHKRKNGFTIVELLVAVALVVVLLAVSGVVFRAAVEAQRAAAATGEIMQKYRAITYQLETDLQGLDKTGEIFIAWVPGIDTNGDQRVDVFTRMDRIYFFTSSGMGPQFHTYNLWTIQGVPDPQVLYGQTARVCYMLAGDSSGHQADNLPAEKRILGRSQHLYISPSQTILNGVGNPILFPNQTAFYNFTAALNNLYEFDTIPSGDWLNLPTWFPPPAASEKAYMAAQSTDIDLYVPAAAPTANRGIQINPATAQNLHMLLAQGVGEFKVQGWFDAEKRWFPEVDPDGDGDLSDTDFFPGPGGTGINSVMVPDLLYPGMRHYMGPVYLAAYGQYPPANLNQANFNSIPGLGPALKFTFTLYDSKGVFKEGKTFTYIVNL